MHCIHAVSAFRLASGIFGLIHNVFWYLTDSSSNMPTRGPCQMDKVRLKIHPETEPEDQSVQLTVQICKIGSSTPQWADVCDETWSTQEVTLCGQRKGTRVRIDLAACL